MHVIMVAIIYYTIKINKNIIKKVFLRKNSQENQYFQGVPQDYVFKWHIYMYNKHCVVTNICA